MPLFTYSARDASGRTDSGELDAPSRRDAVRILQARKLQPLRVSEAGGAPSKPTRRAPLASQAKPAGGAAAASPAVKLPGFKRDSTPTRRDCLPFMESLADLIRSGMSAGEAIRLLAIRLQDPRLKRLFGEIWARLGEGQSLSAAFGAFPKVFDQQTVNLIAAGEATGNLGDVLERLIRHYQEQKELRAKLTAALAYPVFICCLAVGVILFFLFFLLPRLQTLLTSLGGKLPLSTQILVSMSEFLLRYGIIALVAGVVGAVSFVSWRRTAAGRASSDEALVRMPVLRGFITRTTVLNFCQTLAVLLENGITTSEALRLAERTVPNLALRERLHEATDRVLEGERLSLALGRSDFFPPLLIDRISVAEQTGNLAPGLRDISRTYRAELDHWLSTFTKTISAGVLVTAFSFVAFIAFAIVSAVFQVSSSFKF